MFGVIGQNGAGKTSVFNLLNGFIKADETSDIDGKEIAGLSPAR